MGSGSRKLAQQALEKFKQMNGTQGTADYDSKISNGISKVETSKFDMSKRKVRGARRYAGQRIQNAAKKQKAPAVQKPARTVPKKVKLARASSVGASAGASLSVHKMAKQRRSGASGSWEATTPKKPVTPARKKDVYSRTGDIMGPSGMGKGMSPIKNTIKAGVNKLVDMEAESRRRAKKKKKSSYNDKYAYR